MRKQALLTLVLAATLVGFCGVPAAEAAKPHALISDGMVLQRDKIVPIWGSGAAGETVTVAFQGQKASATVKDGKWLVRLKDLKAGGPFTMTITGKNKIEIKDVLVGEVWVCSGQSNMAMTVKGCANADEVIANSANPMIRLFTVPRAGADEPVYDIKAQWKPCGPKTVGTFSGVGYFFGRELNRVLKVPVGLINSSYGGTPAESWTARPTLESNPQFKSILDRYAAAVKNYPKAMERYKAAKKKYWKAAKEAKAQGKRPPRAPRLPMGPNHPNRPSGLYYGMISPLQPGAIRGAIWYQGESNAGRAYQYRTLFPAMIRNWRDDWGQGEFPFLFVQLAPFQKIVTEPVESAWAELREAQLYTSQTVPNTAMAVITDVGDEKNIHPKRKNPVGVRLALAARALAYGEKIEYSGPEYRSISVEGDKIVLQFKHVGGGLVAKGGPLTGFTIAGKDRKFVNATAKIKGDEVIVSNPKISDPVAVRFGWANYPTGNLWNKAGLPASPFRTDDFPMLTKPKEK